ncbi:hypothetical protein CVT26_001215 [Gymnopilus dilepis]|uniref:Uncharacterized protein n=1 Tax=Gymnopilus dilepis TaxID=231916 RepID=A0A409YUL7_9AGAR|nr:hypothetical protein CVT26_001215 [Gymnopilus dilepis]
MFVAVTSRTRALAMELREALQLVESSVGRLKNILAAREGNNVNRNDVNTSKCLQQETRGRVNDPILNHVAITQDGAFLLPETTASPPNVVVRNSTSKSTVVIEKVISTIPPTKKRKAMEQSKQDSKLEVPKKKKRTVARNEIDDIFGF